MKFLSLHIPKCGGTSMHETLNKAYGDRYFWHLTQCCPDYDKYDVIHGTFRLHDYPIMISTHPVITIMRHPVDRLVSHYYHLHRPIPGPRDNGKNRINDLLFKHNMSFMNFARTFYGQWKYPDMKHISIAGIFEDWEKSLRRFEISLGITLPRIPPQNVNTEVQKTELTEAERWELNYLLKDDIKIYDDAVRLHVTWWTAYKLGQQSTGGEIL